MESFFFLFMSFWVTTFLTKVSLIGCELRLGKIDEQKCDSELLAWSVDTFLIPPVSHPSFCIASIDVHYWATIIQKGHKVTGFQCHGTAHTVSYC